MPEFGRKFDGCRVVIIISLFCCSLLLSARTISASTLYTASILTVDTHELQNVSIVTPFYINSSYYTQLLCYFQVNNYFTFVVTLLVCGRDLSDFSLFQRSSLCSLQQGTIRNSIVL